MEHATHFQAELDELKQRLLEMGALAQERLRLAVAGLVERDSAVLERVLTGDAEINSFQVEIDNRSVRLLALHQPMAVDLRAIVAAVKINSDLERVGDLSVNIAEAGQRYMEHLPVKELVDIPKMAELAQGMLRDALESFVGRDLELAQSVLTADDTLDSLKSEVFRDLLTCMLGDPTAVPAALDLILISRHLERVGDHATNVAEDVIFMVSAQDVRHPSTHRT